MDLIVPNWPAPKNIKAFASTRVGGVSEAPYQGLNLGSHVGDDLDRVVKNRHLLQQQAAMPSHPVWLNQTHSTVVAEITSPTADIIDADGAYTQKAGVVCCAMTADCLPVLLTNTHGDQVAAVHAGWRGLASGILELAVEKFDGEILAWLGPAIGPDAFEVGEDVLTAFTDRHPQAKQAFRPGNDPGKWWANMAQLATLRLKLAGVGQVFDCGLCTYSLPERFYSYRRDGVTGRQATFIWME
ncbi:peptidoglycan editing factor PgeF [Vibrio sp.]|uniref:peptidoglycan editing factor PgeF n=1 Tax=Vibrio sp. TaxID=678 RepID=UPI003D0C75B8